MLSKKRAAVCVEVLRTGADLENPLCFLFTIFPTRKTRINAIAKKSRISRPSANINALPSANANIAKVEKFHMPL